LGSTTDAHHLSRPLAGGDFLPGFQTKQLEKNADEILTIVFASQTKR